MNPTAPDRAYSPAAERNRQPICAELLRLLAPGGQQSGQHRHLLEIASGSGQHAAFCAPALPGWLWWPSDLDAALFGSVRSWCADAGNVMPPMLLDVSAAPPWPDVAQPLDAIFCANLLHIEPWHCCAGLMRGAAAHLGAQGLLLVYGPFLLQDRATAPSNLAFDADLRRRNPQWGLRELGAVLDAAAAQGLALHEKIEMPANNWLLVLGRQRG